MQFTIISLLNSSIVFFNLDIEKEIEINKEFLFDFVFINPNTMNLCNFKIGAPLVVQYSHGQYSSAKCWPLLSLQVDKIAFSKQFVLLNNMTIDSTSSIQRIFMVNDKQILSIKQITLNIIISNSNKIETLNDADKKLLLSYLKEIYLNKFIIKNQLLSVIFMGQKFIFEIESMITHENRIEETDEANFNENFEKQLKISNSVLTSPTAKMSNFNDLNLKPTSSSLSSNEKIGLYLIDKLSDFKILNLKSNDDFDDKSIDNLIKFKDIGGLYHEIELIKDLFINPFEMASVYKDIGI